MSGTPLIRPSGDGVRQRLAEIGLPVPEDCIQGVIDGLIVLQDHMETLRELQLGDGVTLALGYRP